MAKKTRREFLQLAASAAAVPPALALASRTGGLGALSAAGPHHGVAWAAERIGRPLPAPASWVVQPFALDDVALGDSLFQVTRDRLLNYARAYDPDRVLSNFRATAGLDRQGASPPGGWDSTTGNLRGHFSGHLMTLFAQAYADSGEAVFKDKLDYIVAELAVCQDTMDARSARIRQEGVFGNALRLTGAPHPPPQGQHANDAWPSEYVALPAGIVSNVDSFTIALWVNPVTVTNGVRIFDFGTGTGNRMDLAAVAGPSVPILPTVTVLRFAITIDGTAGEQALIAPVTLPTDAWTHVAVTLSGNEGRLYVNGALVALNPVVTLRPSSLGQTNQNWIGRSQNSTTAQPPPTSTDPFFNGLVDEFHIYDRALSPTEVAALATGEAQGAGTVAAYRFDEDYGAEALDSSGNDRHATVVASPTHPGFLSAYTETQFVRLEHLVGYSAAGIWAPYYTLHKIVRGLLDAYQWTGNDQGLEVAAKVADWVHHRLSRVPRSRLNQMWAMYIAGEYGGMNEILADIHAFTGKEEHLEAATYFDNRQSLFDASVNDQDIITGLHANTHVPQFTGYARMFDHNGDPDYYAAAENFWRMVVPHRMFAHGGTSGVYPGNTNPELFQPRDYVAPISGTSAETCTTYNLLKLTRNLFFHDPDPAYMDYYERGLFSHILGSRRTVGPGTDSTTNPQVTYFVPMSPGAGRGYGNTGTCCGGTGLENHTKYQESIYFRSADQNELWVNLYIASTLHWPEHGFVVTQETDYPLAGSTRLIVDGSGPLTIKLRVPGWVERGFVVTVNGVEQDLDAIPGTYVALSRDWSPGDVVDVSMPFSLRTEPAIDDPNVQSLFHGPVLLVIRSGQSSLHDLTLGGDLDQSVTPAGEPNHFETNGHQLVPFYIADTNNYHAYFRRVG